MKVVLPWPDKRLSPNARLHFRVVSPVKAVAREEAAKLTYAAMPCGSKEVRRHFAGAGPISYQVTFYPPDKRHRDDDNMIGSFKAARDGIADALGVNDRRFKPHYFFEEPCKPGRVEVDLSITNQAGDSYGDNFLSPDSTDSAIEMNEPGGAPTPPARDPNALQERIG